MTNKGLLIVVSGPSGTGKGTICKQLLNAVSDLKLSVSATTRAPRADESQGVNYSFIDKQQFETMINEHELLEYAKVYDNFYGTPKKYVVDEINKGNDVLLEIDIQGALQVKEKYPEGVFVFILPPSMKELKKRIVSRGSETEDSLNKRYKSATEEISFVREYNYLIINDEVDMAVEKLKAIISAEKCKITEDVEEVITKFKEEMKC
ncbi:MAG: guanylate kinase [Alkaliphilus sp.]|nr:guanylate kinase [Alkaliphilus sp.]